MNGLKLVSFFLTWKHLQWDHGWKIKGAIPAIFPVKSFILGRMILANLNITFCRVKIDVWLHDLNAAFDDSTAADISLCVAFGTRVTN